MGNRVAALEDAVRGRSRGRLELLAFALSPDGHWAATLLRQRETGYWLESLYEYGAEGWVEHTTSNGGLAYTSIGEDDEGTPIGVLRYYGEAPSDSQIARIRWRDEIHQIPVQRSHFAFAVWDATDDEVDRIAAGDPGGADDHGPKVVGFGY